MKVYDIQPEWAHQIAERLAWKVEDKLGHNFEAEVVFEAVMESAEELYKEMQ